MSLRSILSAVFLSLAVLAASVAEAETVYVQSPTAEGPESDLRASLFELVKAAVSNQNGYSLTDAAKGADLQLQPRLLKLGSSYIVSVDKLKGEKLVYTSKLKASSADEVDNVASRVVRSVLLETKAEEDAQVGDVAESEVAQNTRRIQTTRQWKLGFGPAWGNAMNTDKSGMNFLLGFVWGIDPNFDLDLSLRSTGFEKKGESGAHFGEFMIGTSYYLSRGRNTPFLTAGLGRAWGSVSISDSTTLLNTSDDTASGWAARVGLGYKFFRTSTVNLGIEVNYSQLFAETERSKRSPGLTSATLALYY